MFTVFTNIRSIKVQPRPLMQKKFSSILEWWWVVRLATQPSFTGLGNISQCSLITNKGLGILCTRSGILSRWLIQQVTFAFKQRERGYDKTTSNQDKIILWIFFAGKSQSICTQKEISLPSWSKNQILAGPELVLFSSNTMIQSHPSIGGFC